jgi:pimeloyl-ACP methyl ester carboxylesterase
MGCRTITANATFPPTGRFLFSETGVPLSCSIPHMTLFTAESNNYHHWLFIALIIFIVSCSEKDEPAPPAEEDNLVEATVTGSRTAAELKFFIQLSGRDIDPEIFAYDVDIYNVVYTTTYKDAEIEASGLVILPKTTSSLPMISFQHGTIVKQSDAPSVQSKSSQDVISYTALASMGFITVVPDLIGFGESKEIFHPYYVEEPTATAVIDLLKAAATLVEAKRMDFNSKLFLAGYSQGGYATLATHKAVENASSEGFNLVASFPGAGGYHISALKEYFFSQETYNDPYYLAYVGMSYQSHYEKDGLIESFFSDPYAERIPGLFDGVQSSAQINSQLTNDVGTLVKDNALSGGDVTLTAFLEGKFEENSLVDWVPEAPVFLYHGEADVTVPFENSQLTYKTLISNGASADDLQLITLPGDHNTALEPYIVDVINKLQELK